MMNDMILDELLTQWKAERAPKEDTFVSAERFEAEFFAKVAAEKPKRSAKKMSVADALKKMFGLEDISAMPAPGAPMPSPLALKADRKSVV